MRKDGVEQLNPELFLRSTPSFLVWLIRLFFLEGVMTRYYDFRKVTIDLIANFYKEQRPEFIPMLIATANSFFAGEDAQSGIAPLTEKEIISYYKEDAMIWRVYLAFRKIDRFLHLKILGKALCLHPAGENKTLGTDLYVLVDIRRRPRLIQPE